MNKRGRESVEILDVLTNAARRGSVGQQKRLLGQAESRLRAVSASAYLREEINEESERIQSNDALQTRELREIRKKVQHSPLLTSC